MSCAIADTVVAHYFDDSKSTVSSANSGLSVAQEENLRRARQVALDNRASRALMKAEARVLELKKRLGITMAGLMTVDQINRVSQLLAEQEARHDEKRNGLIEEQNKILSLLREELRFLRKSTSTQTASTVAPNPTRSTSTAPRPIGSTNLSQVGTSVSKVIGRDR